VGILSGKRCLVTGATGGLGSEIARALAAEGAVLFLTGRKESALSEIAAQTHAAAAAADLASTTSVESMIGSARQQLGRVEVLVNCAGVFPVGRLGETSIVEFDRCFAVNVRAPFQLCQAFVPEMVQRGWGRVVNIGSSSAYAGFKETSVYCASKHGLLGLSRALHDEVKAHNVRVLCVSPGSIKTDMGHSVKNQDFSTFLEPKDVARFTVDLINQDGSMVAEEVRLNRMTIR
jgi:3-oxoacyl-[acyl-carrier protein] reductase